MKLQNKIERKRKVKQISRSGEIGGHKGESSGRNELKNPQ